MPLTSGQRIGPYEILTAIGAGGMGEVYKARDTRLERTVAVKVLPAELAGDPEFRARFEREAKSISALNHPNICTLYDVGETSSEGASGAAPVSFLVMEYLDGETLADRIKKGPLPVEQAIEIASQIADALDKAHRSGIVHRDLKPANVFLVRAIGASGAPHCKLLDFGLAKVGAVSVLSSQETKLKTTTVGEKPLTSQGTILGTFQYMAPEQIEGQDCDARTDIWAFGCVLYEMLTARRAFEGKSQASLIASILERQPASVAELRPLTPPALGRLVRTCLEKNADHRFHTAHDLWLSLQWIEEGGSAAGLPAPVVAGRRRRDGMIAAGVTLVAAALAAAGGWWLKPAPVVATDVVTRFTHSLPADQRFTRLGRRAVVMSPDGATIAYTARNQIYLRRLSDLEAEPIRGTEGLDPLDLAFAPDSQSIAFFVPPSLGGPLEHTLLKKIATTGGTPVTVCPAGVPFGSTWEGDQIVFSIGSEVLEVPETGGKPRTLATAPADGSEAWGNPQIVGDGRWLLFTRRVRIRPFDEAQVVVQPIGGGAQRVLVDGGTDGRILPTGHLIWIRENTIYAQAIDLHTLQLSGGPIPVVEHVTEGNGSGPAEFSVSSTGTAVYVPGGGSAAARDLVWVDRSGHEEPTGVPPGAYTYPRVSPDGTRAVANTTDGDQDLFLWDFARKTLTKLTSGPDIDSYSAWTPDGRSVVYRSGPAAGQVDVYRRAVDGTGTVERLTNTPGAKSPQMVTSDGTRVLVRQADMDTTATGALMLVPLTAGGKAEAVFPPSLVPQTSGEISPDGHWIAYQSIEGSTLAEIHVRPFPNTNAGHWQISSGGGLRPMWSRSGRELFYQTVKAGDNILVHAAVRAPGPGGAFSYGAPEALMSITPYAMGALGRAWDISPDDKRFLMIKNGQSGTAGGSLVVVSHWFDELKARVKAK